MNGGVNMHEVVAAQPSDIARAIGGAFDWAVNHWAFCAIIIGIVFEVPKWKLKPFTALFRWIGRAFNRPIMDEIKAVDTKVDNIKSELDNVKANVAVLSKDVDMNEMDQIRSIVLDFSNSCRNGRGHTQEEYNHIIGLNDKYEALLKKHDIKNGVYEAGYKFVVEENERCKRENSYLA